MIMAELNGILVLNKPKGYTSHDAVNVIRKILGTRKVGHTGTLDPNAEGVLPICVGKSTKACDMITLSDKEYIADVKLGVTTDTYDIWGTVQKEVMQCVSKEELLNVLGSFVGEIEQIPPMYSAIKQAGKKLYELARQGIEVERKPRNIHIHECELLDFSGSEFKMRVLCSKGTYIRSLCHDIGNMLGCGACMTGLVRTKSSVFSIEESMSFDEISDMVQRKENPLACVDRIFLSCKRYTVNDVVKMRLLNGAYSLVNQDTGRYRVYDEKDTFIGIANITKGEKGNVIKLEKAFI